MMLGALCDFLGYIIKCDKVSTGYVLLKHEASCHHDGKSMCPNEKEERKKEKGRRKGGEGRRKERKDRESPLIVTEL